MPLGPRFGAYVNRVVPVILIYVTTTPPRIIMSGMAGHPAVTMVLG